MPAGGPRRWGFHQLTDHWARRLVESAGVQPGDLVLDIGAGTGAITAPLVATGARVVAIELHPDRVATLRRRFDVDSTRIVRADAADLRLPRRPFTVVANPPWAITTPILRRLLSPGSNLVRADLVIARDAALRWAAGQAPGVGRWIHHYRLSVGPTLPRRAFRPPPPTAAAILTIQRR
ncbi:MAG: rRNA adenine N-6-methyltransferase family protein [Acidimicrobiales bacterium]